MLSRGLQESISTGLKALEGLKEEMEDIKQIESYNINELQHCQSKKPELIV